MPVLCRYKLERGRQLCETACPAAAAEDGVFRYARAETASEVPPAEPDVVDVAILDMNHGWPNLGHDSLVHAVQDAACDLAPALRAAGLTVRAISYDVRRRCLLPEGPGGRFALYLGTGGPGHLDPRRNDGVSEGSQGIREDPGWEAPLFRLLDQVAADGEAALLAVCHTFGVMCRWAGVARPLLRGPEKGGKSSGVLENALTDEALAHPFFGRFGRALGEARRFRIVDNRLFDLVPSVAAFPAGVLPMSYECDGQAGSGAALTMIEFARDRDGEMPRVLAVNHHPEIVDRSRQLMILRLKLERGEVSIEWYEERAEALTRTYRDEDSDERLHLTSDFTLLLPLRFHLARAVRRRAEALGREALAHEELVLEGDGTGVTALAQVAPSAVS